MPTFWIREKSLKTMVRLPGSVPLKSNSEPPFYCLLRKLDGIRGTHQTRAQPYYSYLCLNISKLIYLFEIFRRFLLRKNQCHVIAHTNQISTLIYDNDLLIESPVLDLPGPISY